MLKKQHRLHGECEDGAQTISHSKNLKYKDEDSAIKRNGSPYKKTAAHQQSILLRV